MVYLTTWQSCRGQYIGKSTTPFKKRYSNHKQEIKKSYGGLSHHYGGKGCGYENVSIQLIEQVQVGDSEALARQEVNWQNQLCGYVQNGGHAHCYRKGKNPKKWNRSPVSAALHIYILFDVIVSNYVSSLVSFRLSKTIYLLEMVRRKSELIMVIEHSWN